MKTTVAKTFKTIFIVLAVVLLIIAAVLYFIDSPVVEEGQTPTVAQKIILLGKKYLGEILAVCGVSALGLLSFLAKLIYNSVKKSLEENQATSAVVLQMENKIRQNDQTIARQNDIISTMSQKQDIANNLLMTIFSLSELPASVREQIHKAQTEYNGLSNALQIAGQVVDTIKNADESKEQPAKADDIHKDEQASVAAPKAPVLL